MSVVTVVFRHVTPACLAALFPLRASVGLCDSRHIHIKPEHLEMKEKCNDA